MAKTIKKSPRKTTRTSAAKIKTPKKSLTKSAKTTTTKVTKKIVQTKAVTTKPVTTPKTKRTFVQRLNMLNFASGILSLGLAAAAGLLINTTTYQLFTSLLTKDELASKAGAVLVPAVHSVYDLQLRWAVVGILLISAVIPLLLATKARKNYEQSLTQKVMLPRWIDGAIFSALSLEVVALLSGIQDIMVLKLIGGLVVITCILSWFVEKQFAANLRTKGVYTLSIFTGILPWLVIAVSAISTAIYGRVRSPWYVYALYAATILGVILYIINGKKGLNSQQSYEVTERNYIRINMLSKLAFAVILIVGLYKV